jgi:hypothetical protein
MNVDWRAQTNHGEQRWGIPRNCTYDFPSSDPSSICNNSSYTGTGAAIFDFNGQNFGVLMDLNSPLVRPASITPSNCIVSDDRAG